MKKTRKISVADVFLWLPQDIVMPNLDGVSATQSIRKFDMTTPIISMTSNTTAGDCLRYLENGMNDILPKPFNKQSLLGVVER